MEKSWLYGLGEPGLINYVGTVLRNKARNMRSAAASFMFGLSLLSAPAFAEPLTLEVTEAEASRKDFADFSAQHVGDKIDLRIDGNSVMKTVIREPITGGVGQILAASQDGARQLTERLKSKAPLVVEAIP
jgi:hypothetical protein